MTRPPRCCGVPKVGTPNAVGVVKYRCHVCQPHRVRPLAVNPNDPQRSQAHLEPEKLAALTTGTQRAGIRWVQPEVRTSLDIALASRRAFRPLPEAESEPILVSGGGARRHVSALPHDDPRYLGWIEKVRAGVQRRWDAARGGAPRRERVLSGRVRHYGTRCCAVKACGAEFRMTGPRSLYCEAHR